MKKITAISVNFLILAAGYISSADFNTLIASAEYEQAETEAVTVERPRMYESQQKSNQEVHIQMRMKERFH